MINRRTVVAAAPAFMLPVAAIALPLAIEFDDTVARRALAKVSAEFENTLFLANDTVIPRLESGRDITHLANVTVISRQERIDVKKMFPNEKAKTRRVPIHPSYSCGTNGSVLEQCFRAHFNEMNDALKAVGEGMVLLSVLMPLSQYRENAKPVAILKDNRTGILFEIAIEKYKGISDGYMVTGTWMVV